LLLYLTIKDVVKFQGAIAGCPPRWKFWFVVPGRVKIWFVVLWPGRTLHWLFCFGAFFQGTWPALFKESEGEKYPVILVNYARSCCRFLWQIKQPQ